MTSTFITDNLVYSNVLVFRELELFLKNTIFWQDIVVAYKLTSIVEFSNVLVIYNCIAVGFFLGMIINYFNLFSLFKFSEKELNALNDLVVEISVLLVFFCYFIYTHYIFWSNLHLFFNFLFLLKSLTALILVNICLFLFGCGYFFIIFIRGAGGKQIFSYELVYDFINLLSFSLRLTIQIARIFILTVLFFTFFHAISELFYYHITNLLESYIDINSELGNILYILFEYIHMFILVVVQVSAFIIMLFWLFQFLFTAFVTNTLEFSYI